VWQDSGSHAAQHAISTKEKPPGYHSQDHITSALPVCHHWYVSILSPYFKCMCIHGILSDTLLSWRHLFRVVPFVACVIPLNDFPYESTTHRLRLNLAVPLKDCDVFLFIQRTPRPKSFCSSSRLSISQLCLLIVLKTVHGHDGEAEA
jgi:hypothetical protein